MALAVRAMPLALLLLLAAAAATVSARGAGEELEEGVTDPEVTVCRQQCVRQRQCDEYGRAKRQEEEPPQRERDRCLHECRAGPPKRGCERRCRDGYTRGGGGSRGGGPDGFLW